MWLLSAEAPVLPDFKYDTGLQPSSGPAQAQITLTSAGSIIVDAAAARAGGKLAAKPGGGTLKLDIKGHNLPEQKDHDIQPLRTHIARLRAKIEPEGAAAPRS